MAMKCGTGLGERLARFAPGARLLRTWSLQGGVSGRMQVVEYERYAGEPQRVVIREQAWGEQSERRQNLERELLTLRAVRSFGLPAPEPYGLDVVENSEPALLREYLEASPDLAPTDQPGALRQMAEVLWGIHGVSAAEPALAFLPQALPLVSDFLATPPGALDESLGEARIRAALPAVASWPLVNRAVLLHGDYWPGNLLWREGRLERVIDWEETRLGDPLFDLAIARLDVAFVFGASASQAFTAAYQSLADLDYRALPHWDLNAALRPMHQLARWAACYPEPPLNRPDVTEHSMREAHAAFVEQALASL